MIIIIIMDITIMQSRRIVIIIMVLMTGGELIPPRHGAHLAVSIHVRSRRQSDRETESEPPCSCGTIPRPEDLIVQGTKNRAHCLLYSRLSDVTVPWADGLVVLSINRINSGTIKDT